MSIYHRLIKRQLDTTNFKWPAKPEILIRQQENIIHYGGVVMDRTKTALVLAWLIM